MKKTGLSSILIAVTLLAVAVRVEAQQPKKVPQIGYLTPFCPPAAFHPFRGNSAGSARAWLYQKEQNIAFEYRYADGKRDRLPELAAELVRLNLHDHVWR